MGICDEYCILLPFLALYPSCVSASKQLFFSFFLPFQEINELFLFLSLSLSLSPFQKKGADTTLVEDVLSPPPSSGLDKHPAWTVIGEGRKLGEEGFLPVLPTPAVRKVFFYTKKLMPTSK